MPNKLPSSKHLLKRFVGDTYFDAFLQAQNEMGENISVIASKPIQKKSWGGIFTQEMVEITVAVLRSDEERQQKFAPSKPLPAEDLTGSIKVSEILKDKPRTLPTPSVPSIPLRPTGSQKLVSDIYKTIENQKEEITKIPENLPYSKKNEQSKTNSAKTNLPKANPTKANPAKELRDSGDSIALEKALEEIMKQKEEISTLSNANQVRGSLVQTASKSKITIEELESKIKEVCQMLQEMRQFVEPPPAKNFSKIPEGLKKFQTILKEIDTPASIQEELLNDLSSIPADILLNYDQAIPEIQNLLRKKLKFSNISIDNHQKGPIIMILMGPTGVGKTTTIAKLAASFALNLFNTKRVALFTLDTYRIGASAQLSQYAQIIEADFEIIYEVDEVRPAIEKHFNKDIILVDTAGRCQKNYKELQELKDFLECFPDAQRFLVLDSTSKYNDLVEREKRFGEVGYDHFIFTKVDETNSFGPLLGIMVKSGKPTSYITCGQSVPDDFKVAQESFFFSSIFK
ncbi:MAG: flagellar biosynthesis protein FlhF [Candidatus Riflebacteria bacterium]|nr:flagellar biosynthesis protein FlhF [Candidatus Riflebacteria bacterium]